jgi:hypothetical protein
MSDSHHALTAQLEAIRRSVVDGRVLWQRHALERMLQRGISRSQVKQAILNGFIVESHPEDRPVPSLLLARRQPEALHVVLAYDANCGQCHVITVYRPDLIHFEVDLTTRRLS